MSQKEIPSRICEKLINENWHSYADDVENVPEAEGIYTIGIAQKGGVRYLYTGHSIHVHTRFIQHKHGKQQIDEFIKKQLWKNGGRYLRMKWILRPNSKFLEGTYINCIEHIIGYRLKYNIKRGNGIACQ